MSRTPERDVTEQSSTHINIVESSNTSDMDVTEHDDTPLDSTSSSTSLAVHDTAGIQATIVSVSPATEFIFFPQLPGELRNIIWNYAIADNHQYALINQHMARDRACWFGLRRLPIPTLMHACQDARSLFPDLWVKGTSQDGADFEVVGWEAWLEARKGQTPMPSYPGRNSWFVFRYLGE